MSKQGLKCMPFLQLRELLSRIVSICDKHAPLCHFVASRLSKVGFVPSMLPLINDRAFVSLLLMTTGDLQTRIQY